MKQRIITSVILTLVVAAVFAAAYFYPYVFNISVLILTLTALFECMKAAGTLKKLALLSVVNFAFAVATGTLLFIRMYDKIWLALIVYILLAASCTVFYKERKNASLGDMTVSVVYTVYITAGFGAYVYLNQLCVSPLNGIVLILTILLGTWMCDIGGWLFGITMGKHKLCPNISPKKSVEGLLGSIVFAIIGFTGLALLSRLVIPESPMNLWLFLGLAPVVAFAELVGDLTASVLKREHGVKDYGNVIVGHGGIMDRFDGVIMSGVLMVAVSAFTTFFTRG